MISHAETLSRRNVGCSASPSGKVEDPCRPSKGKHPSCHVACDLCRSHISRAIQYLTRIFVLLAFRVPPRLTLSPKVGCSVARLQLVLKATIVHVRRLASLDNDQCHCTRGRSPSGLHVAFEAAAAKVVCSVQTESLPGCTNARKSSVFPRQTSYGGQRQRRGVKHKRCI